jgi:hypothetical protein
VFSLSEAYGKSCAAGPHRVLKVGKAGPKSDARFRSQHYNQNSSISNLANSLLQSTVLWSWLGVTELTNANVGSWIKKNTDRDHFYLDSAAAMYLSELEKYIRGRLGPVFEGG